METTYRFINLFHLKISIYGNRFIKIVNMIIIIIIMMIIKVKIVVIK